MERKINSINPDNCMSNAGISVQGMLIDVDPELVMRKPVKVERRPAHEEIKPAGSIYIK